MTDSINQDSQAQPQQQPPIVSPFIAYGRTRRPDQEPSGSPLEPFPPFLTGLLPYSSPSSQTQRFTFDIPYTDSALEVPPFEANSDSRLSPSTQPASSPRIDGRSIGSATNGRQVRTKLSLPTSKLTVV